MFDIPNRVLDTPKVRVSEQITKMALKLHDQAVKDGDFENIDISELAEVVCILIAIVEGQSKIIDHLNNGNFNVMFVEN